MLVLVLAVGTGPEAVSAELVERLDLRGTWVCTQDEGWGAISYAPQKGSILLATFHLRDEGGGRARREGKGRPRLGIYQWQGSNCLIVCFRSAELGRPTSFDTSDGQELFVFRRVQPGK
jgi:hypothetical protein